MKQIIVIKTTPDRYDWLNNILKSMSGYDKYPIFIYSTYDFIYPGIFDFIDADEMVVLHDSLEITNTEMFDILFEKHKGKSVMFIGDHGDCRSVFKPFSMGLGKFKTSVLKSLEFPIMLNYEDEIKFELQFGYNYLKNDPHAEVLLPNFDKHEREAKFEKFLGRENKIITTPYFIKYQGHWTSDHWENVKFFGRKK